MKKFDSFKTLTRTMQSFLAIVLVTLMAVGNVAAQKQWQLVTDVNSLAVGDSVVIAASTADFALSVTQNNNNRAGVAFTKEGDILQMNEDIQTFVLQAGTETGTYAFYTGSGYLYAASSSSNYLKTETTLSANSSWEITIAASGEATVVAQGPNTRNNMRFNPNNGNPIFAAYASTSTMAKVVIYKLSTTAPVAVATPILTPASGTYYTGQTVTITCATEGANIYYTLDGSTPTASSTLYTAPIAIDSTTTVKAVAIVGSDNSNVATAVYTFPAYTALANIAAFKEQTSTTELFKINSDLTVIFQTEDKFHTFVQDNSAAIYVYGTMDKAYNPGDVIPGGMYGNYALYKQMNELKPVAGAPLADGVRGTEVQPVVVTLADLIANYANYEGKLVTVENVTVGADHTFQNGSASGANVSQDTNTIQIYSTFKNISKSLTANQMINVTGLVIRYNNTIEIAPRSNSDIVVPFVEVPYVLDFDTNTDDLVLANGNATNKWYVGEAQGFATNKLYISSTNGATNKYDVSATSNVKASRGVIIPAKGAVLSFTSRVNGEEGKDMLNVYLYNYTNDIINTTPTWKTTIVGENEWTEHTFPISAAGAGKANLVFEWVNNNNGGEQFPAAIDNIQIVEAACAQPTAINATVSADTATITWTLSDSTQTAWTLEYKLVDHTEWYTVAATQPSVVLSGLQGSSVYDVRVKANCGDESSEWTEGQFEVGCLNGTVVRVDTTLTIGSGTATNSYVPFYYNYSFGYSQQIYTASELNATEGGTIKSIKFKVSSGNPSNAGNVRIWLGHTNKESFSNSTDYINPSSLSLVYAKEGAQTFTQGWNEFVFNTPFNYNGTDNLVVAYYEGYPNYGGSTNFASYTASNRVLYQYSDGTGSSGGYTDPDHTYVNYEDPASSSTSSKSLSSNCNQLQLTINVAKADCNDQLACETPASVTITNITTDAATVAWTGNADSYVLECKTGENEWTAITVNDTTYTFSNLEQKTTYTVRVKAVCGENNNSLYTDEVAFTTTSVCPVVTDINTSNLSTTTTISWTPGGNETAWTLRFRPVGTTEWVTLNISGIPSTTFGGLLDQTDYEVEIMALCDPNDEDNQSSWAPYLFTSGCAAFELPYVEEFEITEIPACWTAENFTFDGTTAQATEAGQWLMTPPITVPASGNTYVVLDIKGSASILASYRGTALNRFDVIGNIANNDEMSHVIFQVPDTYKDKAVNFMFQANGPVTIETAEFTQCAFVPTDLTAYDPTNTTVELSWIGDNNNGWVVEYAEDGSDNWTTVNVEQTSDTAHYTLTGLTGATAYKFRVRTNCAGGSTSQPSNVATITTHCDPISVPFTAFSSNADANFNCWNNYYSGTYEDNGAFVAANNDLKMYNYYNRTTDAADNTAFGNVYAVLPKFDTTLNALQITFTTEQWTLNNNSKIQLGVVTDVNHPVETFRTLNEYNAGDNAATFTYILNNATDGNLAFRLLKDSLTQEVRVRDILVEYIPACQKPNNLVATPISESSMSLNWGIIGRQNNWDIKYKATQFSYNPDNDGTLATANLRPRILNNLEYGQYYTFYIRNHCSATEQSEWVGPFTYKLEMNYNIVNAADITTCHGNVIYQADTTGDNTLIIRPSSTGSWVTLSGNVQLGAATLKVYDGTAVNTDKLIATFTGSSVVNLTPACATELTLKLENVGTTAPVINLAINCDEVPTCSAPSKPEFDIETLTLTWEAGCWGTPESYNIQMMDATTGTTTDLTSTTNSLVVSMPNDHTITFKVQPVCDGENGDWSEVSEEYVKFACGAPTAVTATYNEGAQTATISWTPFMANQRNFEVGYKLHDAFTWVTATVNNATTYTTAALDESQTYDVRVKAICGDEESEYITTTVETPCVTIHEASGIITLGSGTSTNTYLPSYNYYNYSFSEQIYTTEEIGMSGEISSVAFYNGGTTKTRTYDVYMVHTAKSTFANGTDWIPVTEENKVFSGSVTMTNGEWTTITFNRPFQYNGRDNLLLVMDDNTGNYSSSPHMACRVYDATSQALRVYSDGTNYNPSSPSSYSGTVMSVKNQVQFNITGIMCDPVVSCPAPSNIVLSQVDVDYVKVSWSKGGNESNWTVVYTLNDNAEVSTTTTDTFLTITGLEAAAQYTLNVSVFANCDETHQSEGVSQTFTVNTPPCAGGASVAFTGTGTSNYFPTYNLYNYSYTQQIFTAQEINAPNGGQISSLTFEVNSGSVTRNIDVYLMHTRAASVSSQFLPLNNAVKVYSGNTLLTGEVTLNFSTPFDYNGTDNLVVIVDDNTGSWQSSNSYKTHTGPTGCSRYVYNDNANYDPTSSVSGGYSSNIRNNFSFTICPPPACSVPTNFAFDAETSTLTWTGNAQSYTLQYREAGTEEFTTVTTTNASYTFTGLSEATRYEFQVQGDCGETDGLSRWSPIMIFTVPANCTSFDMPFEEGFEESSTTLGCWTVVDADRDGFIWGIGGQGFTTHSGDRCAISASYDDNEGELTPDNWLISPAINIVDNAQLRYWMRGQDPSYAEEYYSVYVATTNTVAGFLATTPVDSGETTDEYVETVVDLSSYAGQTVYIAFRHHNVSDMYYLNLDDVSVIVDPCAAVTITEANPYTEGFEEYTGSNEIQLGNCWYSDGAGYTAGNGVHAPFVYGNYAPAAHTGSYSLEMKGNQGMVVLPEFTNDINTLSLTFWANRVSSSATDEVKIGVITDINDPTTFVPMETLTTVGSRGNSTFVGPIEFNNVPATGRIALRYTSTSSTQSWNLDDFTVFLTPTCFVPAALTVSDVTANTAKVSWTDPKHQGNYAIEYKEQDATTWTTVTGDTTYNVVLTGLNEATAYVVRMKTVCGAGDESLYTDEVPFSTIAYPATLPYHCSFDNEAENNRWQLVNGPATNKWFTGNATGNGDNNALYVSNNEGAANEYTILSAPGVVWAYRDIDVVPEYVYHLSFDWKGYGESSYDYMYVYVGDRSDVSASTSTTVTAPANTKQMVNPLRNSNYFNQNDSWATFTYELDSTFAGQRRIYFCWRNDNSVGTQPPAAVDNISIIALNKDLVAEAIKPISDNCDLSNAEVSVTVKNNTMSDTVRSFTASYQMSETAAPEDVVTETITPTAPIMPGETYTFNFATAPTFVDGSNNIYVTLNYEGDVNEDNNVISLLDIRQVVPASVPYVQDFSNVVIGRDAWTQGSENNNPNLWKNSNGVMTYMDNDTMAAQNYFITHCIEIPAGQMQISYDYNALSSLSESMNVYMGTTPDIASMTLIGSHTDFSKAEEDYTYDYLFNNANEGIYYIAVEALSQAGNMGITFDNLKIMPIIDVTVTAGPNGTVSPLGLVKVPYNGDLTINIIPDNMYHTAGVWVDGERVMNEDPFNASFMMYTLSNITESHTINVEFKMEFHINKYAYNYDSNDPVVGGYFVPAHADTLLNPTGHVVTMIADEHYSLHSLVVGITPPASEGAIIDGTNVIADVVYDPATRTYTYTFDTLYVSNYYVQACFKKDTVNIHYRVLTGAGIFDGVNVAAGESHDTWVNYGSDHTSTIAPADGYYTMAVTVNALNAGIIDHYDFDSIVTTQYVTAQFGHKVTASIHNLNDLSYLGSDEVRGTIAPAEQMVLSGSSCSVSGTVQEHFHLSSFLVNGVDMLSDVEINGNAYTFTIDSLVENTDIVAEVQIDQVAIYYMVDGGNGYVNGNEMNAPAYDTLYIDYMSNWMSMFEAATGYHIVNVMVNGTSYNEIPQWLTEFITEPQHIVITFALNEYDITTAAHGNGTVSAGAHIVYSPTSSYTFTATPAVGHHISQILRNNEYLTITDPEATYTETISPVLSDYNYVAFFEPNIYTITATADANGTIDPYGAQNFEYGSTPVFSIIPNTGYAVADVTVDGVSVGAVNTYTFAALTGNHTIHATFSAVNHTITASAGNGGTITPTGATTVQAGSTVTFTITPDAGYVISDVTVDSVSVGALTSYTFEAVNANHTINATFAPVTLTINAIAGANGSINPSGVQTVAYGSTPTFTVAANNGYVIDYVSVDGQQVTLTNNAYTFAAVTENHEIYAAFKPASYTITVTDPVNGTIAPNGVVTVGYQATPTFLITPAFGYEVTAITVNGTNVLNDAVAQGTGAYTYTFPPVTANRTLTATMTKKSFTITKLTPDNHGTITGPTTVDYGENAAYTIAPSAGYVIDNVLVDGMSVGAVSSYIFHNVTANHTITATFKLEPCVVPFNLQVINIDSTSATLTWYHPGADSYDIQYKTLDATTWTLVQNVPGFAYNLTNLQSSTNYIWKVKANTLACTDADWSNANNFKTSAGPSSTIGVAEYVKDHVKVYAEHNRVHIVNDFAVEIENVAIYDMYGKLIYSGEAINNPEVIELNVAVGTYVVRLNTVQGPAVYKVHINR